jgi:hypothetical protein
MCSSTTPNMSTSFHSEPEKTKNALKPEADEQPSTLQFSSEEEAVNRFPRLSFYCHVLIHLSVSP